MALSFCSAFGGALSPVLGLGLGAFIASKIDGDPSSIDDYAPGTVAAVAADGSDLCTTDGGSYDSNAGGGGGGDGGEP